MSDLLKILIPSAMGLVTAILASYFSARWAVRRAFQERWWERKERAYAEIVEALHDCIRHHELCTDEYLSYRQEPHPKADEFSERANEAYWKIQRATDIGAFVISEKASEILMDLRKRTDLDWRKNSPLDIHEEELKCYREALEKIRQCAREDLRV